MHPNSYIISFIWQKYCSCISKLNEWTTMNRHIIPFNWWKQLFSTNIWRGNFRNPVTISKWYGKALTDRFFLEGFVFFVHSLECKIQLIVPVQNLPDQNRSTVFNKFRNKKGNRPRRKVRPPVTQIVKRHQILHLPSCSIIFAPFFLWQSPPAKSSKAADKFHESL